MKVGDLVRVPYQGLGILISFTASTALVQLLFARDGSRRRARIHPFHLEIINENR